MGVLTCIAAATAGLKNQVCIPRKLYNVTVHWGRVGLHTSIGMAMGRQMEGIPPREHGARQGEADIVRRVACLAGGQGMHAMWQTLRVRISNQG